MLWHRCLMSLHRTTTLCRLTDCVSEDLAAVSEELGALGVFGSELGEDIDVSVFAAESQKYGDCWSWPTGHVVLVRGRAREPRPADDFKLWAIGRPRTWWPNANATALPAVSAFARRLPLLCRPGENCRHPERP